MPRTRDARPEHCVGRPGEAKKRSRQREMVDDRDRGRDDIHRRIIDTIDDPALLALDAGGKVSAWSAAATRMLGWKANEIIGRDCAVLFRAADVDAGEPSRFLAVGRSAGSMQSEGWRRRKDGEDVHVLTRTTTLHDDDGAFVGLVDALTEIGPEDGSGEALRESEERFSLLVRSVHDYGIFMLDPTGHIVSWNEGAANIKGYTAAEIIGRHFSTFYPPEDIASRKPDYELEVAAAVGRFEDEGWRLRKDGSAFWANVVITALRGPDGRLVGFAKVTRDLTDRRAAEQKAIQDAKRVADAEAANRSKSEFLAAMSHELRTPLNAIGGFVDLIALGIRGPVTDQQREDLLRIRHSQQRLLGIINDLLNYSRIEAGSVTYDIGPVELARVLADVRPMIEPQTALRSQELSWPDVSASIRLCADGAKTEQILLNLLTNAVKFTSEGGHIGLSVEVDDDVVRLTVADDGVGIEPIRLDAVFEPFVQIGRSFSSAHEGAGLGLSISRDLARAMNGDLTAASTPGVGSRFTLLLPRECPPTPASMAPQRDAT
jgi:PAS domain S-box-containing protein